jgi:hypothetical protein
MIVTRTDAGAFTAEFESEAELRDEHRSNLTVGGLRLPTMETAPPNAALTVTLRGPWGADMKVKATVVAQLPDAIAVAIEGDPDAILERLLEKPVEDQPSQKSTWDRIRGLPHVDKLFLAAKADRAERAVLLQDNDPRVLLSVLRNPRLTVDEVVRVTTSSFLNYQIADVIMNTSQWMANLDVRLGLIRNPKTPQAFSLRILPTLPDSEVRNIARAGTNMALKQAALRRIQGR